MQRDSTPTWQNGEFSSLRVVTGAVACLYMVVGLLLCLDLLPLELNIPFRDTESRRRFIIIGSNPKYKMTISFVLLLMASFLLYGVTKENDKFVGLFNLLNFILILCVFVSALPALFNSLTEFAAHLSLAFALMCMELLTYKYYLTVISS